MTIDLDDDLRNADWPKRTPDRWEDLQGEALKYDPDQPRDDQGQWTDGGSTEPIRASDRTGLGEEADRLRQAEWDRIPQDWRAMSNADVAAAVQKVTGASLSLARPPDSNRSLSRDWKAGMATFVALHERFPDVKISAITAVSTGLVGSGLAHGVMAAAYTGTGASSWIGLAVDRWMTSRESLYKQSDGFHPAGCDTPSGIITHEFGHALSNTADFQTGALRDGLMRFAEVEGQIDAAAVSGYAKVSDGEKFAEIFSAAYTPTSQDKDADYSRALRDALEGTQ